MGTAAQSGGQGPIGELSLEWGARPKTGVFVRSVRILVVVLFTHHTNPEPTVSCTAAIICDWAIAWSCPFPLPARPLQEWPQVSM